MLQIKSSLFFVVDTVNIDVGFPYTTFYYIFRRYRRSMIFLILQYNFDGVRILRSSGKELGVLVSGKIILHVTGHSCFQGPEHGRNHSGLKTRNG